MRLKIQYTLGGNTQNKSYEYNKEIDGQVKPFADGKLRELVKDLGIETTHDVTSLMVNNDGREFFASFLFTPKSQSMEEHEVSTLEVGTPLAKTVSNDSNDSCIENPVHFGDEEIDPEIGSHNTSRVASPSFFDASKGNNNSGSNKKALGASKSCPGNIPVPRSTDNDDLEEEKEESPPKLG